MADDISLSIPYFAGSGLACVRMLLAALGLGDHSEDELIGRLEAGGVPASDPGAAAQVPEHYARLLESYGCSVRLHSDARVSHLEASLRQGHGVIAFLGAKALRRRFLHGLPPIGFVRAGYQPVVVTGVQGAVVPSRSRVVFHDPEPRGGGEDKSLRRGRHTIWSGGKTFEQIWACGRVGSRCWPT